MPQIGTPRTKFEVPSIGSMIHCRLDSPGRAELLAEHGVAGTRLGQVVADHPLDARVGIRHLRPVRLEPHVEVLRPVPVEGDEVGLGGERRGRRRGRRPG